MIDSKPPREWAVKAQLNRAEVLSWQKKLDESISEYKKIIEADSKITEAYIGLGTVYEWQGKYREAKGEYEKALSLEPQNRNAKSKLAQLMWVK